MKGSPRRVCLYIQRNGNFMNSKLIEKLEWKLLLNILEDYCQTQEAKENAQALIPKLRKEEVLERWSAVEPLLSLVRINVHPHLGEVDPIHNLLKALSKGRILEAEQFKSVLNVLTTTEQLFDFAKNYASTCSTLQKSQKRIHPLKNLSKQISNSIDENGLIRDNATPELAQIRSQKRSLRKRIEELISAVSQNADFSKYIQDDYVTMREDRFVIPVKLDGRGRVPGTIIDTSASGQTLFIEPASVQSQNQTLKELELSEKLEIFKILKDLSHSVSREADKLKENYEEIVSIDSMFAEAKLSYNLDARPIPLSDEAKIHLIEAVHPLLKFHKGGKAIANDVTLKEGQKCLIISGPNAGGKTVVLKTVGMIHMMVAAGLMPPVGAGSEIFLFENMFIEMGDTQDLSSQLSTFSGHLMGLKPILENAKKSDIVFLDEICVGTEPQTGAALAQSILEDLANKGVWTISTTHYDNLKILAMNNNKFRSGAMGYDEKHSPTYKLNVDMPGLSFGLEVAEGVGLSPKIVQRARELHGEQASEFEDALAKLAKQVSLYESKVQETEAANKKAEEARLRWKSEVEVLKKKRHELAEGVLEQYELEYRTLRDKFEDTFKKMKKEGLDKDKKELSETLKTFKKGLSKLEQEQIAKEDDDKKLVDFATLKAGDSVYLSRFKKVGKVLKKGKSPEDKIEVEVGALKFQVYVKDLRIAPNSRVKKPHQHLQSYPKRESSPSKEERIVTLSTATNTLDIRGQSVDDGLDKMWKFIDAAILRGEHAIIVIHGHGTQVLKQAVRSSLENNSPYDLDFYPGSHGEGGDGVTIVQLRKQQN